MTALEQVQNLIPKLLPSEKAQALQWLTPNMGNAFPGIESTPGVCGGDPCIAGTRIPVWLLVEAKQVGSSESDLLRAYPTLHAEDLVNSWAYYMAHKAELNNKSLKMKWRFRDTIRLTHN